MASIMMIPEGEKYVSGSGRTVTQSKKDYIAPLNDIGTWPVCRSGMESWTQYGFI